MTGRGAAGARRLPVLPTLIVALAVATMIALGIWQLGRKAEKEALLATYAAVGRSDTEVGWPSGPIDHEAALYRRSRVDCAEVLERRAIAGRSASGLSGWAQVARCRIVIGGEAEIALGWSQRPDIPFWAGGEVAGVIGSAAGGIRLVADPPAAGLAPLAPPDPVNVPNNHLSYAVQWFAFAATALVIYILALRRRRI